jgi:hypothetical protein
MSISFSNVNVTARSASNISIATSNATFVTSNVAFVTSNVAYSTSVTASAASNTAIFGSNVAVVTSNVTFPTSNVAYGASVTASAASNAAIFGSNAAVAASNAARFGSNVAVASSNVAFVTSNVAYGTSNVAYGTSNFSYQLLSSTCNATLGVASARSMDVGTNGAGVLKLKANLAADYHARLMVDGQSNLYIHTTTGPGGLFLGTNDDIGVMSILSAGNVGIGTTVPSSKLHVQGEALVSGSLKLGSGGSGVLDLKNSVTADYHARLRVDAASNLSMFTTSGPGSIFIGASNTSNNIIVTPGGRVGIGAGLSNGQLTFLGTTTSNTVIPNPQALNVNGYTRTGTILIESAQGSTVSSNVVINSIGYTAQMLFSPSSNGAPNTGGIYADYGDVVIRYANGTHGLHLDRGSYAGFTSRLAVGKTWPDYGFDSALNARFACNVGIFSVPDGNHNGNIPLVIGANTSNYSLYTAGHASITGRLAVGVTGTPTYGFETAVGYNALFNSQVGIWRAPGAGWPLEIGNNGSGQSIACTGLISCVGFTNNSDSRFKTDIQPINDSTALDVLRQLEPMTYKYIDSVVRGNDVVYGFIAQQVKQVLPYAVQTVSEVIPNVYAMATVSNDGLDLTFDVACTNKLDFASTADGIIQLTLYKISTNNSEDRIFQNEVKVIVSEILDGFSIRLTEPLSLPESSTRVFVLGQKVNNFNTLDKSAIFSVGIAAVQEVDRQLQAALGRLAAIEQRLAAAGIQ